MTHNLSIRLKLIISFTFSSLYVLFYNRYWSSRGGILIGQGDLEVLLMVGTTIILIGLRSDLHMLLLHLNIVA
jgi:hypothetical protein